MRPGSLQDQVPWTNAFWFADREARQRLTKGFLANKGRSVMRLRRTDRTRIIAESQGNASFQLADSPVVVLFSSRHVGTNSGTQLAHYFVCGYGFAIELRCSLSLPRSAFSGTYLASSARVIVDEGRLKSGSAIIAPQLAPTFHAGGILFANSRLVRLIQLADFVVCILRVKDRLNDVDKTLLRIISSTTECFINVSSRKFRTFQSLRVFPKG